MNHDNITQGRPENTHLGSSGPLEAPRGQTSHTIQNFNKCHFSKKIEILNFQKFKFQKNIRFFLARMRLGVKRRWRQVPQAPSKCRRRKALQAKSAAGAKCCSMASNRKLVASAQRQARALTRRGVHICVRSPGGGRRPLSVYVCMCVCVYACAGHS